MAQASGLALVGGRRGQRPHRRVHRGHRRADRRGARRRRQADLRRPRRIGHHRRRAGGAPRAVPGGPAHAASSWWPRSTCTRRFLDAADVFAAAEGRHRRARSQLLAPPARAPGPGVPRGPRRRRHHASPGGGAAGGLAGGLAAVGATVESGFELIADELDLADRGRGGRPGGHRRGLRRRGVVRRQGRRRAGRAWPPSSACRCWWWPARCSTASATASTPCRLVAAFGRERAMADTARLHHRGRRRPPRRR